jgi:hypothetical protein
LPPAATATVRPPAGGGVVSTSARGRYGGAA